MSKPPVFVLKTGGFGPSGETRYILIPRGMRIMEWSPSSRRPAAVHRTVALNCSSHAPYKAKIQVPQKQNLDFWSEWRDSNSRHPGPKELMELFSNLFCSFLVLSAPKNCAFRTSYLHCFHAFQSCLWSNMWSKTASRKNREAVHSLAR